MWQSCLLLLWKQLEHFFCTLLDLKIIDKWAKKESATPKKTSKFLAGNWLMKNTLEGKLKIVYSKKITKERVQSITQESIIEGPIQARR